MRPSPLIIVVTTAMVTTALTTSAPAGATAPARPRQRNFQPATVSAPVPSTARPATGGVARRSANAGGAAAGDAAGRDGAGRAGDEGGRRQGAAGGKFGITLYDLREGSTLRWSLTCSPDGGTHPSPGRACERLRRIRGDLERLRYRSAHCPRTFDPREVEIRGAWKGRAMVFKERYPNAACLKEATAPIVPGE